MYIYRLLFLAFLALMMYACKPVKVMPGSQQKILFMGHTYQWHAGGNKVDKRLEKLNYLEYDQLWLGGDMCSETTEEYATLSYLNDLFNLRSAHTHWALGNHDFRNGNLEWVTEFTGRKLFYTYSDKGITVMVLNTNLWEPDHCSELEDQYQMIASVTDTISESNYLLVLSHHVIWSDAINPGVNMWETANANKPFWESRCLDSTKYHELLHDKFVDVQERGVQVVFIAGDFGMKAKSFEHLSPEGIWFLGSGINNSQERDPDLQALLPKDKLLLLEYDQMAPSLSWSHIDLDSLISR